MDGQVTRRPRRGRIVAAALLAGASLGVTLLWVQRTPIARSFVDDALESRGVAASYEITRFGIGSQTLENIRIGDPAHPDLVARSAVLHISVGVAGPKLRSIVARGVRLHGRLIDGKVSFGAIDRLLPAPTGAPFALPDLAVDLRDARMLLETPAGPAGLALEGKGNLTDGFEGRLAAAMPRLAFSGCTAERATAFVNIAITDRKPAMDGPLRASRIACAGSGIALDRPQAALDVAMNEALTAWKGNAIVESGPARLGDNRATALGGRLGFDGTPSRMSGDLAVFADSVAGRSFAARRASFDGRYGIRFGGRTGLVGEAQLLGASARPESVRSIRTSLASAAGTPIGPVGTAIGDALARAAGDLDARATIALVQDKALGAFRVERLDANSKSGGRLVIRGGPGRGGVTHYWPQGLTRFDGDLLLAGGGLPGVRLSLDQPFAAAPMEGEATIAPYAAGGSRLSLAPVRFGPGGGGRTRFATRATIDGPIGDGRVQGLSLPLAGTIGAYGSFVLNESCQPLDFAALRLAGMNLGRTRLPLCPTGGALLARSAGGPLRGGARIAAPRLRGRVGQSPLTIEARSLGVEIGKPGFMADAVAVRLGQPDALTRLEIGRLAGGFASGGVGGRFVALSGNIGNVPLLITEGAGDWRLASSMLTLGGAMHVADSAAEPRFNPLISNDMRLRLENGIVTARGWLRNPATGTAITEVTLRHDLSAGRGNAILDVPGIGFGEALQPEALTRLTLGVVANVVGTVKGRGEIRWTPQGVTSDGLFDTEGVDLAAAFGPVTKLKGQIRFSDLLGLETAPGQSVTLGEVNPGIAVNDGVVRYQLLPGQQVKIEGGRWPFSGGELLLDETVLDFARPSDRNLTFRVVGMDAAQFVQQFDFKNISVTGTFDGVLPMIFDVNGGRIVGGRLVVRRGGGTLAYVGEVSNADLGMFGKLAFDALKSIRYDNLAIELNGSLDGEIVSKVIFTGINEAPLDGKAAPVGMLQSLTGLPFKFNITIKAPFRGLINSAQSLTDPRGLISRSIGSQVELPGSAPVQPQESETIP
jgi:hypothetical protein